VLDNKWVGEYISGPKPWFKKEYCLK